MNTPSADEVRPLLWCAPLLCVFATSNAAQMTEDPPNPASPVAKLRFEVPEVSASLAPEMTIHGTIPLPPGTYGGGPLEPVPFKLVDYTGALVDPTQVDVVSRYADAAADGADVVEISGRIPRDPTWIAGKRKTADVVISFGAPPPDPGTPDIQDLIDGPEVVSADLQLLLSDPQALAFVVVDTLGQKYFCFPFDGTGTMRTDRHGRVRSSLRVYQTLLPVFPPPPGDQPHHFGVHTYLTVTSEENALLCDVRFNNAADGYLESTPVDDLLGEVFFQALYVYVVDDPSLDWTVRQLFRDPFGIDPTASPTFDTLPGSTSSYRAYPLVSPIAEAADHWADCRSQFFRRLVIAPEAELAAASIAPQRLLARSGQAFSKWGLDSYGEPLWSWWNPDTARYFPQRTVIAKLNFTNASYGGGSDMRATLSSWYANMRDALANNQPFTSGPFGGSSAQLGPARPLGNKYGGTTGGGGIQFVDGERSVAVASLNGFRYQMLRHRLHSERMPNVLYDAFGDPSFYDKWVKPHPSTGEPYFIIQPGFQMDMGPNDPTFCPNNLPTWNQNAVAIPPSYKGELEGYDPHDLQHLSRILSMMLAISWIGNDPLAKDDVLMMAELFRMTFQEHPNINGNCPGWSLCGSWNEVASTPNRGFHTGRGEGWGLDATNAAYAFQDDAWRARMLPWYDQVLALYDQGMGRTSDLNFVDPGGTPYPFGYWSSKRNDKLYGVSASVLAHQVWEEMILDVGIRGMKETVYPEGSAEHALLGGMLAESYYGVIAPVSWAEDPSGFTPRVWSIAPVTPFAYSTPPVIFNCDPTAYGCAGQNPLPPLFPPKGLTSSTHYTWSTYADAVDETGDPIFLDRPYQTLTGVSCGASCTTALKNQLEATFDPTSNYSEGSNKSPLLGRLQ